MFILYISGINFTVSLQRHGVRNCKAEQQYTNNKFGPNNYTETKIFLALEQYLRCDKYNFYGKASNVKVKVEQSLYWPLHTLRAVEV